MTLEQQKQIEREFRDAKSPTQTAKQKANTPRSVGVIMRMLMGQAASAARGECGAGMGGFAPGSDKNLIVLGGSSRRL